MKAILKTKLYTLKNGLKVFLSRNANTSRIYTSIAVRVGSKHDPKELTGLSHCLEHMLFKGTNLFGTINYLEEKKILKKIETLYEEHRSLSIYQKEKRKNILKK